jgi:hypothetical protein
MPRRLYPVVDEQNITRQGTHITEHEGAEVIDAVDVEIFDSENIMPDDPNIPPTAEVIDQASNLPQAQPAPEPQVRADAAILTGIITMTSAGVGAVLGAGVETYRHFNDSENSNDFDKGEYKDDVVGELPKYISMGAAAGGALGMASSLMLAKFYPEFGDVNRYVRDQISNHLREGVDDFRHQVNNMGTLLNSILSISREQGQENTEGDIEAPQINSQETQQQDNQTQEQAPQEQRRENLRYSEIHNVPGAHASRVRTDTSQPSMYDTRSDIENVRTELLLRSQDANQDLTDNVSLDSSWSESTGLDQSLSDDISVDSSLALSSSSSSSKQSIDNISVDSSSLSTSDSEKSSSSQEEGRVQNISPQERGIPEFTWEARCRDEAKSEPEQNHDVGPSR